MSKGSPRVTVRLPRDLVAEVTAIIERSYRTRPKGPFDESEFIRIAVIEKIAKMERCRKPRGAKRQMVEEMRPCDEAPTAFSALGPPVSSGLDEDQPMIV